MSGLEINCSEVLDIGAELTGPAKELRKARHVLVLRPNDQMELRRNSSLRSPIRLGLRLPPGRYLLVSEHVPTVAQAFIGATGLRSTAASRTEAQRMAMGHRHAYDFSPVASGRSGGLGAPTEATGRVSYREGMRR